MNNKELVANLLMRGFSHMHSENKHDYFQLWVPNQPRGRRFIRVIRQKQCLRWTVRRGDTIFRRRTQEDALAFVDNWLESPDEES